MSKNITITLPEEQLHEVFDLVAQSIVDFESDIDTAILDAEERAWYGKAITMYQTMYATIQTALYGDQS